MKINTVSCTAKAMQLKEPYTIAYETIGSCTNLFLKLTTNTGLTAWGCAAPDEQVTGETLESVLKAFRDVIEPCLLGSDPTRHIHLTEQLKQHLAHHPSALAMVDMALYDLLAQMAHLPLYRLLGGYRTSMATSITIGILPVGETVTKAREFAEQGFRILKIKGGLNLEEDIEKVIRIRDELGSGMHIRFDANQGYTVEEAVQFIRNTSTVRIELLEQPTSRKREELLGMVSRRVPVPVMADESLITLTDVFRLTSRNLIDMVNIKLMKVGGITEAQHINSVAKSAGVEAMVGCMDESALGISAGLHFALSRPNVIYADLDGHLDLLDDPFPNVFALKNGRLYPLNLPGLGVSSPPF